MNPPAFSMSDEELLGYLMPKEHARQFLAEYGSLYEVVMNTSDEELQDTGGIDEKRLQKILCLRTLIQRLRKSTYEKPVYIYHPKDTFHAMNDLLDVKQEQFHVLLLNTKNKIIDRRLITQGTLTYTPVAAREVFYPAIRHFAASLILVHNHPSGDVNPSDDDKSVTASLVRAGEIIEIPVLDHVILGGESYFSFLEKGILKEDK